MIKLKFYEIYLPNDAVQSAKANWREPKSCLGRVFNFKLDSFASYQHKRPLLELKTRPRCSEVMDKLRLTGQNLGRVFDFGCEGTTCLCRAWNRAY